MEKEKNSPAATRNASCDKDFMLDVDVEEEAIFKATALDRGVAVAAEGNNGWTRISTPSNAAATLGRSILWAVLLRTKAKAANFCCCLCCCWGGGDGSSIF